MDIDPSLPDTWLIADVGGSNARFGWLPAIGGKVLHTRTLAVTEFPSLADAAKAYLTQLADILSDNYQPPRGAAIAVATVVTGDQIDFTNSNWAFSRAQLQRDLGLGALLVLNDFEALALSLPELNATQLRGLQDTIPAPHGTLAVIGPGTGLGVAGVVETRHGWVVLPSEGGHATLSAYNDFESELLAAVRKDYPHVSAERMLSGIGLPVLHGALTTVLGKAPQPLTTERIVEYGLAGSDPVCIQTLNVFCAMLGSFAGNVALTLGARGGVYIGGGIVPRLGDFFVASSFRERFEAKGRFRNYLEPIPTIVITDTLAALTGAASAIKQHLHST
ncbi:MAG: glucokinase [Betaproteobacteria bacterium]|nr:glucokinase [Betaproteobacteria bacterium]